MELPLPVLCDQCRKVGAAGEDAFSQVANLLQFKPVPRRPHVNGWDEERQRAFIAALVITGSPRRAAQAIGKHAFGAEQLRRARGGASFAEAWDAALEVARERELARLRANLADLAETTLEENRIPFGAATGEDDDTGKSPEEVEYDEARERIHTRFSRARRLLLLGYVDDPARRAAWQVLVGPVDWDRARRMEAQDDEPLGEWRMVKADMVLTVEAGLLHDVAGAGPDAMAPLRAAVECAANGRAAAAAAGVVPVAPTDEEQAIADFARHLAAAGWTEDADGNWSAPAGE